MIGAFVTYYLISKFTINYFLAIALSTVVVGVIGFAIEKALFAPLRGRELSMLMSALGLQITIQGLMAVWVGVDSYSIAPPFTGIIEFDIFSFPVERIFVVGLTLLVLLLFYLLIKFTMIGKALRAVALDDEAAQMQGIPVNRVYTLAFGLGCSLAAIAGALIGPVFSLHVYMGQAALLKAFIVVILGGLGSIPGAVLGGLILGFGESAFATLLGGLTAEMFWTHYFYFVIAPIRFAWATPAMTESTNIKPLKKIIFFGIILLCLFSIPKVGLSNFWLHLLDMVLINAILALGLNIVLKTGQVSLAHAAFFAVGSYGSAHFTLMLGWPFLVALLASSLTCGAMALILGRLILHLK